MDRERLLRQIDFILEADKEKTIFRQTHITNYERIDRIADETGGGGTGKSCAS